MIRKSFVMSVQAGQELEYEKRHNPVWKELLQILKAHGVHNYSIFLNKKTLQLFAYVELENLEEWEKIAQTAECKRWWAYMKDIMPSNSDNSPISEELSEVFHLD